jgi:hypothetical protein
VAHSVQDIAWTLGLTDVQMYFDWVKLASGTTGLTLSNFNTQLSSRSFLRSHDHNQVRGVDKSWFHNGSIETDTTPIAGHTQPYQLLSPSDAKFRLQSGRKCAAIQAGATPTFSVYIYKTAAYNGHQPRLMLAENYGAFGTASGDTVLATATVGTGSWEHLSGAAPTTLEDTVLCTYVDVDGTVGGVDIDDWAVS